MLGDDYIGHSFVEMFKNLAWIWAAKNQKTCLFVN
jgi:hypothetical protein